MTQMKIVLFFDTFRDIKCLSAVFCAKFQRKANAVRIFYLRGKNESNIQKFMIL